MAFACLPSRPFNNTLPSSLCTDVNKAARRMPPPRETCVRGFGGLPPKIFLIGIFMAFQIFIQPIPQNPETDDLNRFLASHRIINVQRQWLTQADGAYLVFVVEYLQGRALPELPQPPGGLPGKIDYQKELEPEAFARFCRLREERKKIAEEEKVRPFVVFTNEQLAELARQCDPTLASLGSIFGVGEARLAKYGPRMIAALAPREEQPA